MQDLASLRASLCGSTRPDVVAFYDHCPGPDGGTGPWVLSQWFPAAFCVDGVRYPTAEHWMMAAKARTFGDDDALARVLAGEDPADAKRAGREVRGFDSRHWAAARIAVVVDGNLAKFGADPTLAGYLASTGDAVLVEASPVDRIWGVGLAVDDPDVTDPARWRGENLLGFALMEVRNRLR